MTGGAVPTATPAVDVLLDKVLRLRAELAEAEDLVRWYAGELTTAQRAYAEAVFAHADRVAELEDQLAQLRAHRAVPLSRLALGVAACAVTTLVGVADGLRDRWRRRG